MVGDSKSYFTPLGKFDTTVLCIHYNFTKHKYEFYLIFA